MSLENYSQYFISNLKPSRLREGWEGIECRAGSFSPNQTKREYNKNRKFPPRRKLTFNFVRRANFNSRAARSYLAESNLNSGAARS